MKYDLAVIGAGFWGTAVVIQAAAAGMKVLLLDSGNKFGGSRNAGGLFRPSWLRGGFFDKIRPHWWTGKRELAKSIEWLESNGVQRVGEDVRPLYGKRRNKFDPDCWMIPNLDKYLLKGFHQHCVYPATVKKLTPLDNGWRIRFDQEDKEVARVVLAAGVWTDTLLKGSGLPPVGVSQLLGRAGVVRTQAQLDRPMRVLRSAYLHYSFRPWRDGNVRVGDTVEKAGEDKEPLTKAMAVADAEIGPCSLVKVVAGYRPVCQKVFVETVAENLVVATGGHRVGLGLSGPVADRCLELLGVN